MGLGLLVESKISFALNLLSKEEYYEIEHFILQQYDPIDGIARKAETLLVYMQNDKKKEGEEYNFTLLTGIGSASINHKVEAEVIIEALKVIDTH